MLSVEVYFDRVSPGATYAMMASLFGKLPIPKFLPQRGVELKTKDSNRDVRKQVCVGVEACKGRYRCCMLRTCRGVVTRRMKHPIRISVRQGTQFISNSIIIIWLLSISMLKMKGPTLDERQAAGMYAFG